MRHWLAGAGPGDVFPFTSELGPPRYAITLPDGKEFSDRWEQSLVMKRLAEQAGLKRLFLHAAAMSFDLSGKPYTLNAPLAEDLSLALDRL